MLSRSSYSYSELFTGLLCGSSLVDIGLRIYHARTPKYDEQTKIGLAVSQTFQNMSFIIPIIWGAHRMWESMVNVHDPITTITKIGSALATAPPFVYVGCFSIFYGLFPLKALQPLRGGKDLTRIFAHTISNVFRLLNGATVSMLFKQDKISLPSIILSLSTCLITGLAHGYFFGKQY